MDKDTNKRARKKKLVYYFSQRVQVSSRFNSKIYTNERNTKLGKSAANLIAHTGEDGITHFRQYFP